MRTLPVIALGLALVMAGCFGGDDDSGDTKTPTTTTPVSSTPAGGTGTGGNGTGTGGTGTGGNGTGTDTSTPTKPSPKEVFAGNANFVPSGPPADPQNVKQTQQPFNVERGYTKLTLNVTYASSAGAIAPPSSGIAIVILDAAGTEIASCPGPAPGAAAPGPCTMEGAIPAAGGAYTPEYRGVGPYTATVSVMAS